MAKPLVNSPKRLTAVSKIQTAQVRIIAHVSPNQSIKYECEWLSAPAVGRDAAFEGHVDLYRNGIRIKKSVKFFGKYSDPDTVWVNTVPQQKGAEYLKDIHIEGVDDAAITNLNMLLK